MSETTQTPNSESKPASNPATAPATNSVTGVGPAGATVPMSSPAAAPAATPAPRQVSRPAETPSKEVLVSEIEIRAAEPKKVGAFVIEDGIEIPPTGPPKKSSEFADVLKALKVGQSFTVSADKRAAVTSAAKNLKVRIATRKAGEEKIRVWRVAEEVGA